MGLLATGNEFREVPSKLTIVSIANTVGTGKTARDGWCCAGFCSNGGITGGYRVQVGSETPLDAGTIALGLPADLGVMQLDVCSPRKRAAAEKEEEEEEEERLPRSHVR